MGSANHKSCAASKRATTLKVLRHKRFRKPKKIIAAQPLAQVWRFEMHSFNLLTAQTSLGYELIMHATKLVNKKLLISFKKYKHLKMRIG